MEYYKNINNIQIKPKIDYFDVQKDLNDLLKLKKLNNITNNINNEDYNDNEFEYLEKSKNQNNYDNPQIFKYNNNAKYNKFKSFFR